MVAPEFLVLAFCLRITMDFGEFEQVADHKLSIYEAATYPHEEVRRPRCIKVSQDGFKYQRFVCSRVEAFHNFSTESVQHWFRPSYNYRA